MQSGLKISLDGHNIEYWVELQFCQGMPAVQVLDAGYSIAYGYWSSIFVVSLVVALVLIGTGGGVLIHRLDK